MRYIIAVTGGVCQSHFADKYSKQSLSDTIVSIISTYDSPCLSPMSSIGGCLLQDSEFALNPVDSKKQLKRSNNYFEQQVFKKSPENRFRCGKHHKGKKYKRK